MNSRLPIGGGKCGSPRVTCSTHLDRTQTSRHWRHVNLYQHAWEETQPDLSRDMKEQRKPSAHAKYEMNNTQIQHARACTYDDVVVVVIVGVVVAVDVVVVGGCGGVVVGVV